MWQPGWEGSMGENGYIFMYGWVPSLFSWNYDNIINQLSVQFSCSVYSNSCPLSWWCHPTISPFFVPFSCLQSFPASGSFPMSQLFASGGQSIGVLASASVLPMNTQDWSPFRWTGWISLQSKDSQESSPTPQFKSINSSALSFLYSPTLTSIHDYQKTIALTRQTFFTK